MFYSAQTGGFYDAEIHGDAIPADAVEITRDEHAALLAGQSAGQRIEADEYGRPVLRDAPPKTSTELMNAELSALLAKFNSDRDAMNAQFLAVLAADGPAEDAKKAAIRQEIADLRSKYVADVAAVRAKYAT